VQGSLRQADIFLRPRRLLSVAVPSIGPTLSYLVPAIAAFASVQTWFRAGTFVASGDVPPFFRTNLIAELPSLWGHSLVGAGSPSFQPVARAPELGLLTFTRALGWSPMVAQRLFYSLLAVGAVLAAVWFVRTFISRPVPAMVGGLVAFFNPFVLQHLPNPLPLWSMALWALLGGLILRAARGDDAPGWRLGAASVGACYLAINPPLLAVCAGWVLLLTIGASAVVGPRGATRAAHALLRATPWVLLLNLWWLFPVGITLLSEGTSYRVGAETDVLSWSWTHARLSIPNVLRLDGHWAWAHPEYFPFSRVFDGLLWAAMRFALPVLAFLAPVVGPRALRRPALAMAIGALGVTLLAKGLHPPGAAINLFLYRNLPGMWLLREPMSKLGPVLVLLYACLAAITLAGVAELRPRPHDRMPVVAVRVGAAMLATAAIVVNFPLFTGAVIPDDRPILPPAHVTVPAGWERLATAVDTDRVDGKALVLPLDDFYQMGSTWGYYGVDRVPQSLLARPTIQPLPGSYYDDAPAFAEAVRRIETALLVGDVDGIVPSLRSLGVSHVIVRHDLGHVLPGRSLASDTRLMNGLRAVPGLTSPTSFGVADVFRLPTRGAAGPLVRSASPWAAPGVPESLIGNAVASLPAAGVTVAPGSRAIPRLAAVGPTRPWSSFTTGGDPVRIVSSFLGPRLVELSARQGPEGNVQLSAAPATRVEIDGEPIDQASATTLDLGPIDDVAAVRADEELIALDEGRATIGVAGGAAITAYVRNGRPLALHGSLTDVRDCNATADQSLDDLGIVAAPLPEEGTQAVTLEARSHSACVRVATREVRASVPLLIEVDHRTLVGAPARLCVWEIGPDRCASLPILARARDWETYRAVTMTSPETRGIRLFLYADGSPYGDRTRIEYRHLRVSELKAAATGTLPVPDTAPATIPLSAGRHTLATSVDTTTRLGPWPTSVRDCNAYDDKAFWEAGLRMNRLPALRAPAIQLRAWIHTACVSAPLAGSTPGGTYELRFDVRSLRGEPARVCLWQVGPNECARLPRIQRSSSWTPYRAVVTSEPGTVGLRLFLYADGGKDEGDSAAAYSGIRLRPIAPVIATVLDGEQDVAAPPTIMATRTGVSSFTARVGTAEEPFILTIGESAADGWTLSALPEGRTARPVLVDGYAQGWLISEGAPFTASVTYTPDRWFHGLAVASGGAWLAVLILAVRDRRRSRRPMQWSDTS